MITEGSPLEVLLAFLKLLAEGCAAMTKLPGKMSNAMLFFTVARG
jgi:hypothetical protein